MKGAGQRIRLLVVDDSALVRSLIPKCLEGAADIEVVGTATDPYVARDKIVQLKPDILTLDIEMPRMDGLTFLKILMEKHPMPVIILSSITQPGSRNVIEALELGAVDVLSKPEGSFSLGETGLILAEKIRAAYLAGKKQRALRHAPTPAQPPSARSDRLSAEVVTPRPGLRWHPRQIGLIGASTGGTEAIRKVLEVLPENCPPLLLVQHIPAFISGAFAQRLDQCSAIHVREACDGDVLQPGLALLAPGDYHMTVSWTGAAYQVRLRQGPKVWYQRPAVDVLFKSAARCVHDFAVVALLTGMGKDGGEGMLELKACGCHTIAQDEASCVVYGMPKTAVDLGAACQVLPLSEIPQALFRQFENRTLAHA